MSKRGEPSGLITSDQIAKIKTLFLNYTTTLLNCLSGVERQVELMKKATTSLKKELMILH